jgi:DNA-binding beta-propeller fold protein YncE
LKNPQGVAVDTLNNILYIADTYNYAVRVVDLTTNIITTFAGTIGTSGSTGDGK